MPKTQASNRRSSQDSDSILNIKIENTHTSLLANGLKSRIFANEDREVIKPPNHLNPTELDPGRIVFFKKGVMVSGHYYICEISYNQ